MSVTQARLKELMDYNPATGLFTAKVRTGGKVVPGTVLGTINGGYVRLCVDGKLYYGHQLAFLYMTGAIPSEIDHDDRCRSNNRWANLVDTTHAKNIENCDVRCSNKLGVKGVFMTQNGRFRSTITRNGKSRHLGCFASAGLAQGAFVAAGGRV